MTIPARLVKAADRRARKLARSRSWVIAQALAAYLGEGGAGVEARAGGTGRVKGVAEERVAPYRARAAEVADARRRHLLAELALSPGERLRRGWELSELARGRQPKGRREQVIAFESYEDYYEWKKGRLIGR